MPVQWTLLLFGLFAGIGLACLGIASIGELVGKFKKIQVPLTVCALALLVVGGLCSFFHLNSPERLFYILGNVQSGITIELILTGISFVVGALFLWFLRKPEATIARKVLAVLGIIMALVLPFSTGEAYSVMTARPAWSTIFLPLMYLVAAWSGGLLLALLLQVFKGTDVPESRKIVRYALVGIVAFAVAIGLWIVGVGMAPHQDYSRSVENLVMGEFALLFWGMVVLLGVVVPLAALFFVHLRSKKELVISEGEGKDVPVVAAASVALLSFMAGSIALRVIVYLIGTSVHSYIYAL